MKSFQHPLTTVFLGSLSLLSSMAWQPPTTAQVTVSPLVIEANTDRNQSQGVINITNEGNEAFRARVYSEPFTYDREKGFQSLETSPSDLGPYLQFAPREMVVPPGTTRRVRFVARLAPNLPESEYRAVLFTEQLNETLPDQAQNQVSITTRIGITVYIRQGDITPVLSVEGAQTNATRDAIQVLVKNTGKASTQLEGVWSLQQAGKTLGTGTILPTTLLTQHDRYVLIEDAPMLENLALGAYQLSGELTWKSNDRNQTLPFSIPLTLK